MADKIGSWILLSSNCCKNYVIKTEAHGIYYTFHEQLCSRTVNYILTLFLRKYGFSSLTSLWCAWNLFPQKRQIMKHLAAEKKSFGCENFSRRTTMSATHWYQSRIRSVSCHHSGIILLGSNIPSSASNQNQLDWRHKHESVVPPLTNACPQCSRPDMLPRRKLLEIGIELSSLVQVLLREDTEGGTCGLTRISGWRRSAIMGRRSPRVSIYLQWGASISWPAVITRRSRQWPPSQQHVEGSVEEWTRS